MDKEDFVRGYAQRSGVTPERLYELGRRPQPCNCGEDGCEKWQMISREAAQSEIELGRLPASVLADYDEQNP